MTRTYPDDGNSLQGLLDRASGHPWVGFALSAFLFIAGMWLRTVPFNIASAWNVVAPVVGIAIRIAGMAGMLVTAVWLAREIMERR